MPRKNYLEANVQGVDPQFVANYAAATEMIEMLRSILRVMSSRPPSTDREAILFMLVDNLVRLADLQNANILHLRKWTDSLVNDLETGCISARIED